jgi:type I restriction enzyme M protein
MLTAETKRRLDSCRDILVGKLPLPTDQIELITLALIYKFMDDLDEESMKLGGKRSFFVGPLEKYRWRALLPQTVSADERMNLFAEGIEAIGKAEHLPALFRDIFRNSFLKFRDGRILTLFLNEVNGFVYSHSEELGNAFEYLLKTMGIQAENGQFRTPRHIIDFMVACLDPQPSDRILDPACGTGGFLVSCYKHILAQHTSPGSTIAGDKLTHDQRQKVYSNLTGYDVTDLMVKLSKVNLFLHGFPDPAIHIYDTLTNETRWTEKADLILANPPFMTPKGGVSPHTKFRVSAKKSEVLFTDYIAEHLTPDGRGGVIVPNGIVATTQNAYVKLRRFLVEDSLVAVVSLPAGVFKPYSGVKTSILLLDKKLARQTKEILFLKITADGFDLGDQRREIEANDLPEAVRIVKSWFKGTLDSSSGDLQLSRTVIVPRATILESSDHSLGLERYDESSVGGFTQAHFKKLGELCKIRTGKKDVNSGNENGKYPFFTCAKQHTYSDEYSFDAEAILIAGNGDVGSVQYYSGKFEAYQRTYVLTDWVGVEGRYLYFLLAGRLKETVSKQKLGNTMPYIKLGMLTDFEIPLTPVEEQQRIVGEIESYQKVIDGARQILAGYRPSLEINPDWPTKELGDVCRLGRGFAFKSEDYKPRGVLSFRVTNIGKDRMPDLSNPVYLPDGFLKEYAEYELRAGDFVIVMVGATTGKIGYITETILPALLNQNMWRFFPDESVLNKRYLYYAIDQLPLLRQGGAQDYIRQSDFLTNPLPLPPLEEQRRIVAELDAEASQMDSVRSLIPRFETKIQRVLNGVWGDGSVAGE